MFSRIVTSLPVPPVNTLLLLIAGLFFLLGKRRKLGLVLVAGGTLLYLALSMPIVADTLCRSVETYPPLTEQDLALAATRAEAIVVLAGGWRRAPEYGGEDTVNSRSLQRLRYGAYLHRRTGLPLALVGGRVSGRPPSEARMMAQVLRTDFGLEAKWLEGESRNTAENADAIASLLGAEGIHRVLLVTHAFHMPRAVPQFEAGGLEVVPAPMGFLAGPEFRFTPSMLWPDLKSLQRSYFGLHELIGRAWYALRY